MAPEDQASWAELRPSEGATVNNRENSERSARSISDFRRRGARRLLLENDWPGNVRTFASSSTRVARGGALSLGEADGRGPRASSTSGGSRARFVFVSGLVSESACPKLSRPDLLVFRLLLGEGREICLYLVLGQAQENGACPINFDNTGG
jgi:hypothetical protein